MSVVDDLRKLLQDLVTPQLGSLQTEVKMFREETNRRFEELRAEMRLGFTHIETMLHMNERLTAVERKQLPERGQQ